MSCPTIKTDHDIVNEIDGGIQNLENRLERDVTNLCTILLAAYCDFRNSMESQTPNKNTLDNLRQQLFDNYSAMYWSLKLHLEFHMGYDQALQHEKLKKLHDLLNYPDAVEMGVASRFRTRRRSWKQSTGNRKYALLFPANISTSCLSWAPAP